jgi:hypothetical protein
MTELLITQRGGGWWRERLVYPTLAKTRAVARPRVAYREGQKGD